MQAETGARACASVATSRIAALRRQEVVGCCLVEKLLRWSNGADVPR